MILATIYGHKGIQPENRSGRREEETLGPQSAGLELYLPWTPLYCGVNLNWVSCYV